MFCAFFVPDFRLQAALRYRPHLWERPVGVVVEESLLVEVTEAAAAAGVWEGMSPSQGLARCLELEILPRALEQERSLSETLLGLASSVSAFVEQTKAALCTVDLHGCRTFEAAWRDDEEQMGGGDEGDVVSWGAQLVAQAAMAGVRLRVGVAENPDLALLAAQATTATQPVRAVRDSCRFLSGLPLDVLEPMECANTVLQGWGITTLGGLARLRRDEVVKRLGPEGGVLWDKAAGRATRLLRLERVSERYEERCDFEHELDTAQPLLFLLRRFLDQLVGRLNAVGRVVAEMRLMLPLSDGGCYERLFQIPSPTADVEVLFRVLDTHVEQLRLEVAPVGVRLAVEPVKPEHQQFRFFEEAMRDPNRFAETLARLLALVGEGMAGVPERLPTHRPDSFALKMPDFVAAGQRAALDEHKTHKTVRTRRRVGNGGDAGQGRSGGVLSRSEVGMPLRRFRPAVVARVEREEVHGVPLHVISLEVEGRVLSAQGPYCLSGEWWEMAWSVEEWDVEMEGGALYRLSCSGPVWLVEGCYERDAKCLRAGASSRGGSSKGAAAVVNISSFSGRANMVEMPDMAGRRDAL